MSSRTESTLSSLLASTSYLLAYALPLLFCSLLLTFAGAFLALDRTSFSSPSLTASDRLLVDQCVCGIWNLEKPLFNLKLYALRRLCTSSAQLTYSAP